MTSWASVMRLGAGSLFVVPEPQAARGCCEIVGTSFPPVRCDGSGEEVVLDCPAGRPQVVGGPYCEVHGGRARAQAEAVERWYYAAPASVGDAVEVARAGHMHLDTTHAYVVVRREGGGSTGSPERWTAWLGLGTSAESVKVPGTTVVLQPGEPFPDWAPHRKRHESREDRARRLATEGCHGFRSRGEAVVESVRLWRERLSARIAEIRVARGGTLSWGVSVAPLDDPVIVELEKGSSWDAARSAARRCDGEALPATGLRPSGEVP